MASVARRLVAVRLRADKASYLTPNSPFQSIRGSFLAAEFRSQRCQSFSRASIFEACVQCSSGCYSSGSATGIAPPNKPLRRPAAARLNWPRLQSCGIPSGSGRIWSGLLLAAECQSVGRRRRPARSNCLHLRVGLLSFSSRSLVAFCSRRPSGPVLVERGAGAGSAALYRFLGGVTASGVPRSWQSQESSHTKIARRPSWTYSSSLASLVSWLLVSGTRAPTGGVRRRRKMIWTGRPVVGAAL